MRKPRKEQKRANDLIGKTFGRLLVVGFEKGVGRTIMGKYVCVCSCGEIKKTLAKSLKLGETQSCGCLHRERASLLNSLKPYEALYNHFLRVANNTKREGNITYEDFLKYTEVSVCHYCHAEIIWSTHEKEKYWRYNLDRKDNAVSYTKDNVVVCCPRCNYGKSHYFTYEEWWRMTVCFRKG
jgi:hypothetical protein